MLEIEGVHSYTALMDIVPSERPRLISEATDIFFETALTKTFDSAAGKDAFFQRWFGHYAEGQPEAFFLATDGNGTVTGYLAGCTDSFSDAASEIIDDISYFTPAFCAALKSYPSHFHINVKPGLQGKGIGRELVARFLNLCEEATSPGVHVVTGASSRAVKFYDACGFRRLQAPAEMGARSAVLVRGLTPR